MPEVGSASLAIIPSFKGFQGHLERGITPEMDRAGKSSGATFGASAGTAAGGRFKATFGRAAKATLLGVAGLGVGAIKLAGDSVKLASDLGESLNAVNVSYGKQAKAVQRLGRQAANSLGLSNNEFNSLSVRFSAFSKTIAGGEGRKVVQTLDDLTTRASDFASVMNLEVNEAAELFQSGLAGETEPLRKFGIDLSAAAVEAHALATGIVDSTDELTESAKVQARYSLLMKSTAKTQGDFANTSDSLANRQRILNARWDDARAKLGTALLPMLEDLSGWVLDKGIPAFERFADWFNGPGIKRIQGFGAFLRDDLAPQFKAAAEFAGDLVGWLDKLPKEVKIGGLAGLAALVGAAKLRGGKGGLLGGTGSVLGLAKPVPVFVTNPGFGGGGASGGVAGGKGKWLLSAGAIGLTVAGAATIALKGTEAIFKLQDKVAPNAAENGIVGTPRNAGFDGLFGPDGLDGIKKTGKAISDTERDWNRFRAAVASGTTEGQRRFDDLFGSMLKVDKLDPKLDVKDSAILEALKLTRLLNQELDWVSRPRQARITITRQYAAQGRQTLGGLQESTNPSGVTVNVGEVRAHDYNDMMAQLERRAREAKMDGLR